MKKFKLFKMLAVLIVLITSINTAWADTWYILGPDGSWTTDATHTLGSSGISNWLYKDLTVSGQWTNFKVRLGTTGTNYGKDSGNNDVTVGTEYTPTTSGGDIYCDFKAGSLVYYFFFNTSTKKLMIQPKYYLAGTCGASNQSWGQTQNAPTYDATNGYFKWNTCTLNTSTDYKFKLCTYGRWDYYNYQDGSSVTVSNGTKQTTDGDNNIIFRPSHAGVAVVTFNPITNALVVNCPYQVSYAAGTGATGTVTASSITTYGSTCTLSSSTFSKTGYTQDGWATSDGGDKVYNLGATYTGGYTDVTLYPHWSENDYTVTVTAGANGSVASESVTAHIATLVNLPNATANTGYYFTGWQVTSGSATTTGGATDGKINGVSATGVVVRANFAPIWKVLGSDEIGGWATSNDANPIENISTNLGYIDIALEGNKTYTFKLYNQQTGAWFGLQTATSYTFDASVNKTTWQTTAVTLYNSDSGTPKGPNNFSFTTGGKGIYRFYYNISTHSFYLKCPASYKITFGKGTGGITITASGSTTGSINNNGYVASGEDVTFTETHTTPGYTFTGWYTTKDTGGSAVSGMAINDNKLDEIAADATVYSRYSENMSTITVSAGTGGTVTTGSGEHSLGVTTTQAINASASTGYTWSTWTTTGNARLVSPATTASNTAKADGTVDGSGTIVATFTPNHYNVTLKLNGGTGTDNQVVDAVYDAAMPTVIKTAGTAIAIPTRTGYTFDGYRDGESSGTKYYNYTSSTLSSARTWDKTSATDLYAKWDANTHTVSLDYDETNHGDITTTPPTGSVTATYDAAMPAIAKLPKAAEGYAFMGYFSSAGGGGTQYYDGTGASVTNWNVDDDITLYAYYKKAEITGITLSAGAVIAPETSTTATATLSPTPAGTTHVDWKLRYANDNPLASQPSFGIGTTTNSFSTPEASGTYKLEAVLRTGSSAGTGTTIDSVVYSFQVAGSHTVTVRYKCGDEVIKAATTLEGIRPLDWSDEIAAPEIFGYTFSSWTAGDGVTISTDGTNPIDGSTTSTSDIYIKAIYDGYLTANYTQNAIIYFKNTLGWSDVYVNFYTASDWDSSDNGSSSQKGAGNKNVTNRNKHMTQIDDTDIWYYDYGYNDGGSSISPSLYVSFTSASQENVDEFWALNPGIGVVYPANYPDAISTDKSSENGFKAATPMFVPLNIDPEAINVGGGGKANYNNAGYWTKYTLGTGYTLEIYNEAGNSLLKSVEFKSEDELMPMRATVDLEAGQTYKYQLRRGGTDSYGIYYGNSGTMTYANHGQNPAWAMTNSPFAMCGITTNAAGDYTFNLSYSAHSDAYRLRMAVDYPIASGDYRLVYTDNVGRPKASAIVTRVNNGKDTVSFFIRPGNSPALKIQTATVDGSTGAISWGSDVNVTSSISSLTKDSVYNICLSMNGSGAISVENVGAYTGNYYIRTDAANSKWDNYRSDPDHLMTFSEYSINHGGYSHYYCHWVDKDDSRKNVKFCIANDYSPSISDTLIRENNVGDWVNITSHMEANGDLKRSANVRFMWNRHDNTISRAYVDGAQGPSNKNFLYILNTDDPNTIRWSESSALTDNKVTFSDNGNWLYEANIQAQPDAQIKLLSNWGESSTITQYFKGTSSSSEYLISGSGNDWYNIRLIYDFKTNRLVTSYIPSGVISDNLAIHADVMFIREHQGDIAQLTFSKKTEESAYGSISDIETAYGVMRFSKWTLNNKSKETGHAVLSPLLSRYERDLFYISFPFRVNLEEVFGFGTYGVHWIIEEYDGAARARDGYWADSESFWKFVTNRKNKFLEPNTGYILALDLDELGESSSVWTNTEQVELYFPSYGTMGDITNTSVEHTLPAHTCNIGPRPGMSDDRRVKDSHWNVMSVPTYVNTSSVAFNNTTWITEGDGKRGPKFLYVWNSSDNSLTATAGEGYEYHAMHAYMVQYYGNVTWTTSTTVTPASIAARMTDTPDRKYKLELISEEQIEDQTFIQLTDDENVSAGFEFNYDLSKEMNKNRANIYTLISTSIDSVPSITEAAANVQPHPLTTTIVPVGVKIAANGEYTFSMPKGTNGGDVWLIDNANSSRTNLGLMDYTVNLTTGTYEGRFSLEFPVQNVVTEIEKAANANANANADIRKVFIGGRLYILRDGKAYDATGAQVR